MPTYVNSDTLIVFAKLLILYSARALTKYFSVCTCPTGVSQIELHAQGFLCYIPFTRVGVLGDLKMLGM